MAFRLRHLLVTQLSKQRGQAFALYSTIISKEDGMKQQLVLKLRASFVEVLDVSGNLKRTEELRCNYVACTS
jgi:hypothetical protein